MNPTQKPNNDGSQTPAFGENFLADLFTDDDRFRAWIATATGTAAQPVPGPTHSPVLGLPMTDADLRRYALREAGYTGWVDADGYARTDAEVTAWDALMRGLRDGYLPGSGGGWVLTEAGRRAFARLSTAEQFDISRRLSEGVSPERLMDICRDGEPLVQWLSDQDADEAESCGERLADRCSAQREAADAREMSQVRWLITDHGRKALDQAQQGTAPVTDRCLRCDAPGGYPYCQRSMNGNWSCADLAGIDEAEPSDPVTGGTPGESEAPATAALVLRLAARYLELHGWTQGAYYDPTATCFTPAADMVGAIAMVCYGGPCEAPAQYFDDPGFLDFEEAVLHLDRYLLVEDGSQSYEFNDARGRRVEDVTRVLRRAAAVPVDELMDALRIQDADTFTIADLIGGDGE